MHRQLLSHTGDNNVAGLGHTKASLLGPWQSINKTEKGGELCGQASRM